MYGVKLSDIEITRRLTRLRNLEQQHEKDQRTKAKLRSEIKQLRTENADLRTQLALQQSVTESQAARIEQLEAMVFGRKPPGQSQTKLRLRLQRPATSYHRPIPPASAITKQETRSVSVCKHCSGPLSDIREYSRFEEDIILGVLTPDVRTKTVTKRTIERGWCIHCGKHTAAAPLAGQTVTIGPNVRLLVVYLITIQGLTYEQVIRQLMDLYQFAMTDGEIEAILAKQQAALLPTYEQAKQTIRAGPAHLDESRYPIQSEQGDGYAWVMAGADGSQAEYTVVFDLADNRGAGHAKDLLGPTYAGVGITDRYGGYKHRFVTGHHQVCWAHLARNARDLTKLQCLGETKQAQAQAFYRSLNGIYALVRRYWAEPYDQITRTQQAAALLSGVAGLCQPDSKDPKQLQTVKQGILEYQDCLFVCLTEPCVPPDNNKAERLIRQLVMKRKRSFGVKTKKGARVMSVMESIAWSLWYQDREQFFPNLRELLRVA